MQKKKERKKQREKEQRIVIIYIIIYIYNIYTTDDRQRSKKQPKINQTKTKLKPNALKALLVLFAHNFSYKTVQLYKVKICA